MLFLDDMSSRQKLFKEMVESRKMDSDYVWSYDQAIEALEKNEYDVVFLDHDLAFEHYHGYMSNSPTGYDVAKWMFENERIPAVVVIHSWNTFGSLNIESVFKGRCIIWKVPFSEEPMGHILDELVRYEEEARREVER